jgi:hypothetical protein
MDKDAEKSMRVFLFNVSATGEINSLAHAWDRGFKLSYNIPEAWIQTDKSGITGIPMIRPVLAPKEELIHGDLVFIATDKETDLKFLETRISKLLSEARSLGRAFSMAPNIRYQVIHVHYTLMSTV